MAGYLIRIAVCFAVVALHGWSARPADAQSVSAPGDFFAQEWRLNPAVSHIYMQSVKKNSLFETHKFTAIDGSINPDGKAQVDIDLASIATGVDLRDVRMRFLFFETFKFPKATITANLDRAALEGLLTKIRLPYTLKFTLKLHGVEKEMQTPVVLTRIVDNAVSVSTVKPVIVKAADFGLEGGIKKLSEAVGDILIAPASSITFDLVFQGVNDKPDLKAVNIRAAEKRAEQQAASLQLTECKTRLDVISKTRAIYFASASAKLDAKSAPLLDSVAGITQRCPSIRLEVAGHTDSAGRKSFNQALSEKRAKSVATYLAGKGVAGDRIKTVGYGDTRPVTANNSAENRAKNRRIEFRIQLQ